MKLSQIIKSTAARMSTITVVLDSSYGTVEISDDNGQHESIFMQGDEGHAFIDQVDSLYEKTGDLDKDTIALYLAEEYTGCLWS